MPANRLHIAHIDASSPERPWARRLEAFATSVESDRVLVKENAMRRVWRMSDEHGRFYVKEHLRRTVRDRLKDALRGSPAAIEFRTSQYARQHGLPAVHIGACADWINAAGQRVALSVAEAIEDAVPLSEMYERITVTAGGTKRNRDLNALIESVADLFAAAHRASFVLIDAHPGNILVRITEPGRFECVFVDVYGSRCGRPVSELAAARNLAALHEWFVRLATRAQRLRLLIRYRATADADTSRHARKAFANLVLQQYHRHDQRLIRKRDRRIGRSSAFFKAVRLPGGTRAWIALRSRYLARLLPIDEAAFTHAGRDWLESTKDESPATTPMVANDANTETLFAKTWRDRLGWKLGASPARQRFRSSWRALHRGIPAVAGVRCVESVSLTGPAWSSWTALGPDDGCPLLPWLAGAPARNRRAALESLGRLLAETALAGLGILNFSHLRLWVTVSPPAGIAVYWSGIEAVAMRRSAPRYAWKYMLCRLAADRVVQWRLSTAEQARVLRSFARRHGIACGDWQSLWRELRQAINPRPRARRPHVRSTL